MFAPQLPQIAARLLLITGLFAGVLAVPAQCEAGQIGPNGQVIGRCGLRVTNVTQRRAAMLKTLFLPGAVAAGALACSAVCFVGYSQARKQSGSPSHQRLLGALVGIALAVSCASSVICVLLVLAPPSAITRF